MGSDSNSDLEYDSLEESDSINYLTDEKWPSLTHTSLITELSDLTKPNTQDLLACGNSSRDALITVGIDPETVRSKIALGREWRRLYTDAILERCLCLLARDDKAASSAARPKISSTESWEDVIGQLDLAIVLAGAPGEGRLDLVLACIAYIQHRYLPVDQEPSECIIAPVPVEVPMQLATSPVRIVHPMPSLSTFPKLAHRPFVIPGLASSWPATMRWTSRSYLQRCAGRGRVIPVERGGDYRRNDWSVELMPWDQFLDEIGWGDNSRSDPQKLYLAQHSLFTQFPKLRADIIVPDYVYVDPPPSSAYTGPPGNDEQVVINAWCGGKGANSPAHTDPYYNIYVQIVGRKAIWLAPPEVTSGMYPLGSSLSDETEPNRDPKREGMLGNTSSLDVFTLSLDSQDEASSDRSRSEGRAAYPLFHTQVSPVAQSTTLGPGDALIIPPGWWHAMRGVGAGSFSVSFWF